MNKHDLDAVSFAFGAVFLSLVVVWLGARLIDVDLPPAGWLLAGALVFFGVLGVVLTLIPYTHRTGSPGAAGNPTPPVSTS
jgi:hypothetical protein